MSGRPEFPGIDLASITGPGTFGVTNPQGFYAHYIAKEDRGRLIVTTKQGHITETRPGDATPTTNLDGRLARAKWIAERFEEGKLFCESVYTGDSPESSGSKFPKFYRDVINVLPDHVTKSFLEQAKRRKMRQDDLAEVIAAVKKMEPSYAVKICRQYRRQSK